MHAALLVSLGCAALSTSVLGAGCSDGAGGMGVVDSGTTDGAGKADDPDGDDGSSGIKLPRANVRFDYQLGGSYEPPTGVELVVRDRTAVPAPGLYNICYVNGFQTQPGERQFWIDEHPNLLLRDDQGEVVIDPDWDEIILDIRTPETRAALAEIVGAWIEQCGLDGFDAVEIDNLDTYSRSGGRVTQDQAVEFMSSLSAIAHGEGMAIAQKNSAEVLSRRGEMATDFAVVEECNRFDECADFGAVYGERIFVIEYRRADFDSGCSDFPGLSILLRDLDLVAVGEGGYVFDDC